MTKKKLFDAIDGFYAWDQGFTDSGIHDSVLEAEVKEYLRKHDNLNSLMAEYLDQYFTSESQRAAGYGYEDVVGFVKWFGDWSGLDF